MGSFLIKHQVHADFKSVVLTFRNYFPILKIHTNEILECEPLLGCYHLRSWYQQKPSPVRVNKQQAQQRLLYLTLLERNQIQVQAEQFRSLGAVWLFLHVFFAPQLFPLRSSSWVWNKPISTLEPSRTRRKRAVTANPHVNNHKKIINSTSKAVTDPSAPAVSEWFRLRQTQST